MSKPTGSGNTKADAFLADLQALMRKHKVDFILGTLAGESVSIGCAEHRWLLETNEIKPNGTVEATNKYGTHHTGVKS